MFLQSPDIRWIKCIYFLQMFYTLVSGKELNSLREVLHHFNFIFLKVTLDRWSIVCQTNLFLGWLPATYNVFGSRDSALCTQLPIWWFSELSQPYRMSTYLLLCPVKNTTIRSHRKKKCITTRALLKSGPRVSPETHCLCRWPLQRTGPLLCGSWPSGRGGSQPGSSRPPHTSPRSAPSLSRYCCPSTTFPWQHHPQTQTGQTDREIERKRERQKGLSSQMKCANVTILLRWFKK